MKILFVCSGNICRSPMAAAYMQHLVATRGLRDVYVESAGTLGIDGELASVEAIEAMAEIGVDLTPHTSRGLEPHDLETSDLILGMTRGHLEHMARWPGGRGERLLVRAFEEGPEPAPDPPDLDDPIGRGLPVYRQVRGVLVPSLEHLADWVVASRS